MFCSAKDKILTYQKCNVVYKLKCPPYDEDYVGKKDRCLIARLNEHSNYSEQPMFQRLQLYEKFLEIVSIYQLQIAILMSATSTYKLP